MATSLPVLLILLKPPPLRLQLLLLLLAVLLARNPCSTLASDSDSDSASAPMSALVSRASKERDDNLLRLYQQNMARFRKLTSQCNLGRPINIVRVEVEDKRIRDYFNLKVGADYVDCVPPDDRPQNLQGCRIKLVNDSSKDIETADVLIFSPDAALQKVVYYKTVQPNPNQLSLYVMREPLPFDPRNRPFQGSISHNLVNATIPYPSYAISLNLLLLNEVMKFEDHTRMMSVLISDCGRASGRDYFLYELGKYIHIDSMGKCNHSADLPWDGRDGNRSAPRQHAYLSTYKFHAAFEKHICPGYISEKVFHAAYLGVIPVYLGSPLLKKIGISTTSKWYIDASDFDSPRELAEYLKEVAGNRTKYNEYFQWRKNKSLINPLYLNWNNTLHHLKEWNAHCYACQVFCNANKHPKAMAGLLEAKMDNCPSAEYNPHRWVKQAYPDFTLYAKRIGSIKQYTAWLQQISAQET